MSSYLVQLYDPEARERRLDSCQHEDELTDTLRQLIEAAHYSGLGYAIEGIWCWLGDGKLMEMNLKLAKEEREAEDWLYWRYELKPVEGGDQVVSFTVTIDGRA